MGKRFFFAAVVLLSVCSLCLISCGDDKDDVKPKDTEVVTPGEDEGKEDDAPDGGDEENDDVDDEYTGPGTDEATGNAMEAVDMGLSVRWAVCNLGASVPEEFGDYYGWGCVEPYGENDDVDFPFYFKMLGGTGTEFKDYGTEKDPLCEYLYSSERNISGTKWDAARRRWGGKWRMPTIDEACELLFYCDWTWTTVNGVNGYIVSNKADAGKCIFLPATGERGDDTVNGGRMGFYWCATSSRAYAAYNMYFFDDSHFYFDGDHREAGYPIRPVTE